MIVVNLSLEDGTSPSRSSQIAPFRPPPNPTEIPHTSDPSSISPHLELPSIHIPLLYTIDVLI